MNTALQVVLQSLTPAERVAFVLHDVFRYSFAEVAEIVGRSPAACRQLTTSARRRASAARSTASPTTQRAEVVRSFKRAWQLRDIHALDDALDPDATAIADGGGLAPTCTEPIAGSEEVAHAWVELAKRTPDNPRLLERTVNGQPGLVAQLDGVVTAFAFDFAGDRISRISVMRNPGELASGRVH